MENKSAVSVLQEYCAQTKTGNPVYEYIDGEDGGYVCKVNLMDMEAYGNGRSKRDAKHLAAANIMRKLQKLTDFGGGLPADGDDSFTINGVEDELTNMNRDMLKELRDYCVRKNMPLPTVEIVQQCGLPNAPEFVACCSVASIKRYGKSDKKKDARQRAAIAMLCVMSLDAEKSNPHNELVSAATLNLADIENSIDDVEAERRLKFKTYRELTEAAGDENPSIKLCDRHNYFKTYYPHLKEAAFKILNSSDYVSPKSKLLDVLSALKLAPRITILKAQSMEPMLQIELNCEYDCVFIGLETKIYVDMMQYFREMLA